MYMAIFHVVVAPFIVLWLVYLVENQWSLAAALSYVGIFATISLYRLRNSRDGYDRLKSAYYLYFLKYFVIAMITIALMILVLVVGG